MTLTQIHSSIANACLIFSLIIAAYGLWRYLRGGERAIDGSFWGALAAGELLYVAQTIIGVVLLIIGLRPVRLAVHILYGVVLAIVIPAAYAMTRGRDGRPQALMYAFIGLFLAGITLRAMSTAVAVLPGG